MNTTGIDPISQMQASEPWTLPIAERISVTVGLASQYTGISRSRLYEHLQDGTLEGKVVSGRRLILVDSLLRLVNDAPSTRREAAA